MPDDIQSTPVPALASRTRRRAKRDYWEKEREKLVLALEQRLIANRDAIPLRELLAADIPEILKGLFRQRAHKIVREEKPLGLHTVREYKLDDAEMRQQLRRLRDMLAERLVFDRSELRPVLTFGVGLQFDVLARPRSALEHLLYRHEVERERDDLLIVLRGLGEEQQYLRALLDRIAAYPRGPVTKEAFRAACHQVELEVYGKNPVPALVQDLKQYQSYCASLLGTATPQDGFLIDNQTVLAMLFERNLAELAENLLPEFTKKEAWEISEIENLVARHLENGSATLPFMPGEGGTLVSLDMTKVLEEAASEIESQLVQAAVSDLQQMPAPAASAGIVIREKAEWYPAGTQAAGTGETVVPAADPVPQQPSPPAGQSVTANKLKIRFDTEEPLVQRAKIEQQPPGPFPSLYHLIDDKNRKAFIRKIFQRDADAYLEFIDRLEPLQTWKEAKAVLDAELCLRNINPYSKEAVLLSDVLFGRYFSRR
ncbi:MAG: hypothetical protein ONB48_04990 [candidate division KSB1 bacterium]|nr:hypothetical protein [candidate division KSB1 bacterium]MDZ7274331.1 hypothetical protein [candidate division KSB1 bacterium]MDZ7285007.1 hypothetical protein [candidate division KSB1 bacterium]MDZ7297572.1 hypothetical protein [candidate division KSB1 bacterium]MDZ7309515.1 hypothetical protein [candidate division KSB1 bacterium]